MCVVKYTDVSSTDPFASQVAALEEKLANREARAERLHRELNGAKEALEGAGAEAREHTETAGLFKDKYTAAMKKVHEVQGQAERLREELQYSRRQVVSSSVAQLVARDPEVGRRFVGRFRHNRLLVL